MEARSPGRPASPEIPERILREAARLIATQGISATSTRAIAAAAATTERTLFKHFGSTDGLVQAVVEQALLPHVTPSSLADLGASIKAFKGDLAAWHAGLLRSRLKAWKAGPDLVKLLLRELLRDPGRLADFGRQWERAAWQPLLALFQGLQSEARVRADLAPERLVRQFLSLNLSFLVARVALAPEADWDDDAEIAAIAATFARGIAP